MLASRGWSVLSPQPSSSSRAYRAWGAVRPKRYWPRSVTTCRSSPRREISPRGHGCARETTRARANEDLRGPAAGPRGLPEALSRVVWAAARVRGTYYRALYFRQKARSGPGHRLLRRTVVRRLLF